MKTFFQIALIVFLALPFLYMIYDILQDLLNRFVQGFSARVKPIILTTIESLFQ
jgi:hypothetical protein